MRGLKGVTPYQFEILTTLGRLEALGERLADFDQLLETLSWTPSKESAQFTIRAMVGKKFIEKAPLESRRGRNRVCYRLLEAGKAVLDPRRMAPEKPEGPAEKESPSLRSGRPEVLDLDAEIASLREFAVD
jgi:DNA-binding PadR family transcriptional regulator